MQSPSALTRLPRDSVVSAGFNSDDDQGSLRPSPLLLPTPSQIGFPEELEIKQDKLRCGQQPEQVTRTENVMSAVKMEMLSSISLGGVCFPFSFQ